MASASSSVFAGSIKTVARLELGPVVVARRVRVEFDDRQR